MKIITMLLTLLFSTYAERALCMWSQGHLGYIGIAPEAVWGTPVAPTDYFEALSESLTESIDRFPVRNIYNGFYEPDDVDGARRAAGDIAMFGHPVSIGYFLKAAFNTVSGSAVLSGFLHRSRFISTKSEFADGVPSQPYTIEVGRDVTSAFQYAGCVMSRLQMSLAPNQDLRVTGSWIAKAALLKAATSPSFPGSPTSPFTFETASLSIGGSATARFESFTMTVNNAINPIMALNGSQNIARMRRSSGQEVRIMGTLDFIDVAEYLDFKNQTERQLQLTLTRSNSFRILIDAPRFIYTTFPTGISGRDRLTVGIEGIARYSTTSGVAVDIGLTTTKSNY